MNIHIYIYIIYISIYLCVYIFMYCRFICYVKNIIYLFTLFSQIWKEKFLYCWKEFDSVVRLKFIFLFFCVVS